MGVQNNGKLPDKHFKMLCTILKKFPKTGQQIPDLIHNIVHSPQTNNQVLIQHGIHYSPYDNYGQFHFNIRLQNRGQLDPTEYHVYIEPFNDNCQISVDDYGTVYSKNCYWEISGITG